MNSPTRRAFFKTAGAGAAVVGASALALPSSTLAGAPTSAPVRALPSAATGSMVAYINDVANGQITVMVEGREVTITDHHTVATLAHAMHSSSKV